MYYRLTSLILVILLWLAPTVQAGNVANIQDPAQLIKLRQSFEIKQRDTYRNNLKNYKKKLDALERKYQQKNASVNLFAVRAEKRKINKDLEGFAPAPAYKRTASTAKTIDKQTAKPPAPKAVATTATKLKTEPKAVMAKDKTARKPEIKAVSLAKKPTTTVKTQPVAAQKTIKKTVAKAASPAKDERKTSVTKKPTARVPQTKKSTAPSPQKATIKPLPLVAVAPKALTTPAITVISPLAKTTNKPTSTTKNVAKKSINKVKQVPVKKRQPIVHVIDIDGIAGSPTFSVHNIYKFKLASIGQKSTLKYYAAGRRTTNSIGKVWIIDKDGKKTMLHKWTAKDFIMPAMDAKKYKDLTPTIIDITSQVTAPGEYKIEFDYIDGIDALGILRVEISS